MIYKLNKKLNSVKASNFLNYQNDIYVFDEDNKIVNRLNEDYSFEKFLQDCELFYLSIEGGLLHITKNKFYNIIDQKVVLLQGISFNDEDYLECVGLNDFQAILKIFNQDGTLEMYKIDEDLLTVSTINYRESVFLIVGNILVELFEGGIQGVKGSSGELIWKQNYLGLTNAERANLHSRILNSEDKLFFVITGNERKGLFVLDIESGDLVKKFEGLSYELFKDDEYIYTTNYQNILCRINVKTLDLEKWDCNDLVKENGFYGIHDHRCDVIDGKFCFTQTLGDHKAKLGILDWDKKELVYKHDFEPENGAIASIQVNKTRMFVHTQDNTLHIFERE